MVSLPSGHLPSDVASLCIEIHDTASMRLSTTASARALPAGPGLLARGVAGADHDRPRAGGVPELDVEPAVADDERPQGVDAELALGAPNHARLRLAAVAGLAVRPDSRVRVMRAVVVARRSSRRRPACARRWRDASPGPAIPRSSRAPRPPGSSRRTPGTRPGSGRGWRRCSTGRASMRSSRLRYPTSSMTVPSRSRKTAGFDIISQSAGSTAPADGGDGRCRVMQRWSIGHSRSMHGRHQAAASVSHAVGRTGRLPAAGRSPLVGRTEHGGHGQPRRGGQVHRARVVRHERPAPRHDRDQRRQVGLADEVHHRGSLAAAPGDFLAGGPVCPRCRPGPRPRPRARAVRTPARHSGAAATASRARRRRPARCRRAGGPRPRRAVRATPRRERPPLPAQRLAGGLAPVRSPRQLRAPGSTPSGAGWGASAGRRRA